MQKRYERGALVLEYLWGSPPINTITSRSKRELSRTRYDAFDLIRSLATHGVSATVKVRPADLKSHDIRNAPYLFKEFALLGEESARRVAVADRIRGFAVENGLLGITKPTFGGHRTEMLADWWLEAKCLSRAMRLARALKAGDLERLRALYEDEKDSRELEALLTASMSADGTIPLRVGRVAAERQSRGVMKVRRDDHRTRAVVEIQSMLQRRIDGQVEVTVVFATPALEEPTIRLRPVNLLSALWMQYLFWLRSDLRLGYCDHCGELFDVTRADRKLCSASCNVAQTRARQDDARERYFAQQQTVDEIASDLGIDRMQAERWIKSTSKRTRALLEKNRKKAPTKRQERRATRRAQSPSR